MPRMFKQRLAGGTGPASSHDRAVRTRFTAAIAAVAAIAPLAAAALPGCGDDAGDCVKHDDDATRYVIVGFWSTTDCSGDPVETNAFPVDDSDGCYCWPGHSGENSALEFACGADGKSFTYTQWTTLTCGGGNTNRKTAYTDRCEQDVPPTLYSRVVDIGPCGG